MIQCNRRACEHSMTFLLLLEFAFPREHGKGTMKQFGTEDLEGKWPTTGAAVERVESKDLNGREMVPRWNTTWNRERREGRLGNGRGQGGWLPLKQIPSWR